MAQAGVTVAFCPAGAPWTFVYDVLFPGTLPLSSSGHLPDRGADGHKACRVGRHSHRASTYSLRYLVCVSGGSPGRASDRTFVLATPQGKTRMESGYCLGSV